MLYHHFCCCCCGGGGGGWNVLVNSRGFGFERRKVFQTMEDDGPKVSQSDVVCTARHRSTSRINLGYPNVMIAIITG